VATIGLRDSGELSFNALVTRLTVMTGEYAAGAVLQSRIGAWRFQKKDGAISSRNVWAANRRLGRP
jgi:hypothetical protein